MTDFPGRIYVVCQKDDDGAETLLVGYAAEDWAHTELAHEPIAVYELKSVGRNESRFVEDSRAESSEQPHRSEN